MAVSQTQGSCERRCPADSLERLLLRAALPERRRPVGPRSTAALKKSELGGGGLRGIHFAMAQPSGSSPRSGTSRIASSWCQLWPAGPVTHGGPPLACGMRFSERWGCSRSYLSARTNRLP